MVCYDVHVEPALQPITGEELARGTNKAPDARLDVHCRGFWERQSAAFFDTRVCHPNADSYRDLSLKQIYRIHENEKKRKHNSRVTEIEQGTFTPLVFTTTGWMADECLRCHSRLAELLSAKKQESYATTISWVRAKVSFCNFAERAPMPKGFENPEKEVLRCYGQGSRNTEGSSRTSLDSTAIDALLIVFILFYFIFLKQLKETFEF